MRHLCVIGIKRYYIKNGTINMEENQWFLGRLEGVAGLCGSFPVLGPDLATAKLSKSFPRTSIWRRTVSGVRPLIWQLSNYQNPSRKLSFSILLYSV